MFGQLLLAATFAIITVVTHLTGLALIVRTLRSHHRMIRPLKSAPVATLLFATVAILGIHTAEIWLYALFYVQLEAVDSFEVALYFSTVTYSSLGYGDILLGEDWRIFGAIEGAVGLLMIGWSTAFLVSLLGQLKLLTHDWLTPSS